jgi:hypothetical protein
MAARKGWKKGFKSGGRVKGTPNRMTRNVKQHFEHVFELLQQDSGDAAVMKNGKEVIPARPSAALFDWAKRNPTDYYKLSAKLIPNVIAGDPENPLAVTGTLTLYMPNNGRRVEHAPAPQAAGPITKRIKIRRGAGP